ncbi:MAG: HAMP domain-containing sensor histidine kinase [Phycisphaerales bacterium]|nr:HAMP domain-containing sensor histidine kinase [Phycisphaerales bacterium]
MKWFSVVHLLLLAYIIAALTFWWLSLEKQSGIIYNKEKAALTLLVDSADAPKAYAKMHEDVALRRAKRSKQYLGEGLTFLVVILIGSSIVYTTYRFSNQLSRQQHNFMLLVTHELKSPIAAMKLILQTLEKHKLDEDKKKQLLSRCIEESDRLNELCNNILVASKMEGGQYQHELEQCSLTELAQSCYDIYNARYPNRFEAQINANLTVRTDRTLLQMVINNVLENALKYTPMGKPVSISLLQVNNQFLIQIRDLGLGIPDAEKKKVFDKFYRIGNENTRATKGSGLGLYLSKKIMHYLKGDIRLKDNKPQGCIFEISIPS